MNKLILTIGIQGSGKSYWSKKWAEEDPENRVRLNYDDIRNMLGKYWVPNRENIVKHIYLTSDDFIRPRHWYSKNKVHCSCPLCSEKRKNGYIPIYELKMIDKMNDMMIEMSFIEENE